MPTIDEIYPAHRDPIAAIAAVEARLDGHEKRIVRSENHLAKLDDTIAGIRETIAQVATKDDILDLRRDIDGRFTEQLRAANSAVPGKFAAMCAAAMVLLTALSFALVHFK